MIALQKTIDQTRANKALVPTAWAAFSSMLSGDDRKSLLARFRNSRARYRRGRAKVSGGMGYVGDESRNKVA